MKGGIIRCTQTEETCPGTRDFRILCGKQGAFETVEKEIEPVGLLFLRGFPGKEGGISCEGDGGARSGYHRFCLLH